MKKGFRQKIIEERLIKCYAEEIASVINQLVVENCNGCIIDPCLMMESDERLSLYFDDVLSWASEASVMENFMNAWIVPIQSKTGPALVEAFKVILSSGRKPHKIMTDQGTEFFNK